MPRDALRRNAENGASNRNDRVFRQRLHAAAVERGVKRRKVRRVNQNDLRGFLRCAVALLRGVLDGNVASGAIRSGKRAVSENEGGERRRIHGVFFRWLVASE